MLEDTYTETISSLKKRYKKHTLTIDETAHELSISLSSMRKAVKEGKNIPQYIQVGTGTQRKTIAFPINCIAKFLSNTQKVY